MNTTDFQKVTDSIQQKLGKESTALIADDLSLLISDNAQMNQEAEKQSNEITKLNTDKDRLIQTNGNLLQKISMNFEKESKRKEETENNHFSLSNAFDENGNFK